MPLPSSFTFLMKRLEVARVVGALREGVGGLQCDLLRRVGGAAGGGAEQGGEQSG